MLPIQLAGLADNSKDRFKPVMIEFVRDAESRVEALERRLNELKKSQKDTM
jgi:hypothetical protein